MSAFSNTDDSFSQLIADVKHISSPVHHGPVSWYIGRPALLLRNKPQVYRVGRCLIVFLNNDSETRRVWYKPSHSSAMSSHIEP
jgi:hypothetical protein